MILFIIGRFGLNAIIAFSIIGLYLAIWLFFKGADTRKK